MGVIAETATAPATASGLDPAGACGSGWARRAPMAIVASSEAETLRWGRKWLESFGCQVAAANSLEEVARLLASGSAEIVVADASLRGAGGAGAWAAIRKLPGAGQLPVLTVCSGDREAARAILEGSSEVVLKPIQWSLLSRRAMRLVQAYRAFQELANFTAPSPVACRAWRN